MDFYSSHSSLYEVPLDTNEVKAMARKNAIYYRKVVVQKLDSIKLLIGDCLKENLSFGSGDFLTEVSNFMVKPRTTYPIFSKDYENWEDEDYVAQYAFVLFNSYKDSIQWYGESTDCYKLEQVLKD